MPGQKGFAAGTHRARLGSVKVVPALAPVPLLRGPRPCPSPSLPGAAGPSSYEHTQALQPHRCGFKPWLFLTNLGDLQRSLPFCGAQFFISKRCQRGASLPGLCENKRGNAQYLPLYSITSTEHLLGMGYHAECYVPC